MLTLLRVVMISWFMVGAMICFARADTVYLKNGRKIVGIVKNVDAKSVSLEVNGGTVVFLQKEVERIERSAFEERKNLRQRWEQQKLTSYIMGEEKPVRKESVMSDNSIDQDGLEDETEGPQEITDAVFRSHDVIVTTLLNDSISVKLVLDTGAAGVFLKRSVADDLGLDLENAPDIEISLADGSTTQAKAVALERVKVGDFEAEDVEAAVLMSEPEEAIDGVNGLLGISFLKRFNVTIDQTNKKLTLERIQE
ncbi:MAG: TIGR02281 family clan AA aspartic protease [Candidatus Omnitrophica bacterium]|nr:TIGR02281 family clan AA aspartic protease [Candidatus Omnitrophota bacterium]